MLTVVYFTCSSLNATEPQLAPELRCYSWMVGDWAAEKVWTSEAALDPKKDARGDGNPNSRVSIINGGDALRIEYGYRITRDIWGKIEPVNYRYSETLTVDGEFFLVSGEVFRTEGSVEQKKTYEFRSIAEAIHGTGPGNLTTKTN